MKNNIYQTIGKAIFKDIHNFLERLETDDGENYIDRNWYVKRAQDRTKESRL